MADGASARTHAKAHGDGEHQSNSREPRRQLEPAVNIQLALLALALALIGCDADGPSASCAPEVYGYESSSWRQEVLDAAVARVDELLDPALAR